MAETNGDLNGHGQGHGLELEPIEVEPASDAELDNLLAGMFEPVAFDIGNGHQFEIRPLLLGHADRLYIGGLQGAKLQRFLLARSVFVAGRPLGEHGAARIPVPLANRLVPVLMAVNGMEDAAAAGGAGAEPLDPKP